MAARSSEHFLSQRIDDFRDEMMLGVIATLAVKL
jgi:hypothetical protein